MPQTRRLGQLFITWGPDSLTGGRDATDRFRKEPFDYLRSVLCFHSNALDDSQDPFASMFFGEVVKELLAGNTVIVADPSFDDAKRRRRVERAFKRTLPALVVEQVQLGGEPSHEPIDGIVIEDDVYAATDDPGEANGAFNESIVVESDGPQGLVILALTRAANRMLWVDEDGHEQNRLELMRTPQNEVYTPNSVTDVTLDANSNPGFYIDCKGVITPPMAERFQQILIEELKFQGVTTALVRVPT